MSDASDLRRLNKAIKSGDVATIEGLLVDSPELAAKADRSGRTPLHHATDWPGHFENVGRTIGLLVGAGADVNGRFPHPDNDEVAETALHWAASSNDLEAVDALAAAGATIDILGGIFDSCTPYVEAIIFEQYEAAARLLDLGATQWLPGAAALGRMAAVESFFTDEGELRVDDGPPLFRPHPPNRQDIVDRAFQFACRAGHLDVAMFLLQRGADQSATTPPGTTAREEAADNGHTTVTDWLDSLS